MMNADTMVMLNTYPNSIVILASVRLRRLERNISLSFVVYPQPVRREIT